MKKLFLLFALLSIFGSYTPIFAQCDISDIKIRIININTINCEVTFDLSWTQEVNSGNKFAYIHIWNEAGYHTPAPNWINMYHNPNHYPKSADLVNALSTIVIDDNHADNPFIGTVYHPDATYILPQPTGLSIVKVHLNNTLIERMTVKNIKLILPSCSGSQVLKFDLWASQSANGKNVNCVTQGAVIPVNQLKIYGLLYCTNPSQFQVFIQNTGPSLNKVTYKVYLDYSPQAILNTTDTLVFNSDSINVPANGTYTSPITGYLPYSAIFPTYTKPLIIELSVPNWSVDYIATIESSCGPLPVKFTNFLVFKKKNKILISWQTAIEQNSRGFEVERKLAGENFRTIAYIPSQAMNGLSNLLLNYQYEDIDPLTGNGQIFYRIKQLDLDNKTNYSELRYIKNNEKEMDLLVYPNPSQGHLNIALPAVSGGVDIILKDMAGSEIKKWNAINKAHFEINNLKPGIYILNVLIKETGDVLINKIIVK